MNSEIEDIKAQIAAAEGRGKGPELPKAHAENRADLRGSDEYRKAFMEFVVHGTEIPAELREDGVTTSSEVGAFVSQPIMDKVIDTVEDYEKGVLTSEQALGQLAYKEVNHQIAILSQSVIDSFLKFKLH